MNPVYICLLAFVTASYSLPKSHLDGIQHLSNRSKNKHNYGIIGSTPANITHYPYTAAVLLNGHFVGGGAIINKEWIITSASLVMTQNYSILVRVGSSDSESGGQILNVSEIIINKVEILLPYNVALLKTDTQIKFSKSAKPIRLAKSLPSVGKNATITGFGTSTLDFTGKFTNTDYTYLQAASVNVISQDVCRKQHSTLPQTCFCAHADGVGPCFGDTGDPLVYKNQLIGLYVTGNFCNMFNTSEVYISVPALRKWVMNTIWQHSKHNVNRETEEEANDYA